MYIYEVILRVTVTATMGRRNRFPQCERVQQAIIFTVEGIEGTQLAHCLGAYCPERTIPLCTRMYHPQF